MIIAADEDGMTEGVLQGDVDAIFVGQDVVIELPVGEARLKGSWRSEERRVGKECA